MHMPSTKQKIAIGYFILTFLGLFFIQTVFFAPQSENLSYRDFKTLLKAGKVLDLLLWERTITGRLSTDGLEGLLPSAKIEELRTSGRGEPRFVTVQVDDPSLIPALEAAGVQFQGRIASRWLGTLLSWIVPALVFVAAYSGDSCHPIRCKAATSSGRKLHPLGSPSERSDAWVDRVTLRVRHF